MAKLQNSVQWVELVVEEERCTVAVQVSTSSGLSSSTREKHNQQCVDFVFAKMSSSVLPDGLLNHCTMPGGALLSVNLTVAVPT